MSPRPLLAAVALCAFAGMLPIGAQPAQGAIECDGRVATIRGTTGPDELRGTSGPDVIAGRGGDDVIRGLGGDDVICGDAGHDTVYGGTGTDRIIGGNGRDTARGESNPFGPGDVCDAETRRGCEGRPVACRVGAVPSALGLDRDFYARHCRASGIPVVTSDKVEPKVLRGAARVINGMLAARPDVAAALARNGAYLTVMSIDEVTTDVPEHAYLASDPVTDWDTRARGLGGVPGAPITSAGEENVMCLPYGKVTQWPGTGPIGDPYFGESIIVHEFAHTVHLVGLNSIDSTFQSRLTSAYNRAMSSGLWANTYSTTDDREYFAVGVQAYFQAGADVAVPDGVRGPVNTRSELKTYDRRLFDLIDEAFGGVVWQPDCVPVWRR